MLQDQILGVAERLSIERKIFLHIAASTLSLTQRFDSIEWMNTLQQLHELRLPTILPENSSPSKSLRVLYKPSTRSHRVRSNISSTIPQSKRISMYGLNRIALSKKLVFQILKWNAQRWSKLSAEIVRCRRLRLRSELKFCFLSILLLALSNKYVELSSMRRALGLYNRKSCRSFFLCARDRLKMAIVKQQAVKYHHRQALLVVIQKLSRAWEARILKRGFTRYAKRLESLKVALKVWIMWTGAVSLLRTRLIL